MKSPRSWCAAAAFVLLGLGLGIGAGIGAVAASPLDDTADLRGQPISQRFLPSGASIVVTMDRTACVVSRRIEIETSVYAGG